MLTAAELGRGRPGGERQQEEAAVWISHFYKPYRGRTWGEEGTPTQRHCPSLPRHIPLTGTCLQEAEPRTHLQYDKTLIEGSCVTGAPPCVLHMLPHLIFTDTLRDGVCHFPHFTSEATEAGREPISLQKSNRLKGRGKLDLQLFHLFSRRVPPIQFPSCRGGSRTSTE